MIASSKSLVVAIVCPCYNEEDVLPISIPRLDQLLTDLVENYNCSNRSFVVLVDDGSKDATWNNIERASDEYNGSFHGLKLSRNVGHQNALIAGLSYVTEKCDVAISIDVDLQDDLEALPKMIQEYRSGSEIVLGVKESRVADSIFKRVTATLFHGFMGTMGVDLVKNHADCRLMSNAALRNLSEFGESFLFLRGLQPLLHNKISVVKYDISDRPAGESKYNLKKMLSLAINGITSFTVTPLRIISYIGAIVFVSSFSLAIYAFINFFDGKSIPGWASITIPLYLLGGLIMLSIGIVGEYIGKIFLEVKHRPRYLIDRVVQKKLEDHD